MNTTSPLWFSVFLMTLGLALDAMPAKAIAHSAPEPMQNEASTLSQDQPLLALVRFRRRGYQRPAWGAPRWSYGGAARGGCVATEDAKRIEPPLVPLVPVDNQDPDNPSFLGITGAAYPSLLVYVPPTRAQAVELLVMDEKRDQPNAVGNIVYQKQIPIEQSPGIVKFDVAADVAAGMSVSPLTAGRHYTWTVTLICDSLDPSGNPSVGGLMQRVPERPAESAIAAVANPYDRINRYAQAGLWHETIATMADLYCANPTDTNVAADWRDMIYSLNLAAVPELVETVQNEDLANAPLLGCGGTQP